MTAVVAGWSLHDCFFLSMMLICSSAAHTKRSNVCCQPYLIHVVHGGLAGTHSVKSCMENIAARCTTTVRRRDNRRYNRRVHGPSTASLANHDGNCAISECVDSCCRVTGRYAVEMMPKHCKLMNVKPSHCSPLEEPHDTSMSSGEIVQLCRSMCTFDCFAVSITP